MTESYEHVLNLRFSMKTSHLERLRRFAELEEVVPRYPPSNDREHLLFLKDLAEEGLRRVVDRQLLLPEIHTVGYYRIAPPHFAKRPYDEETLRLHPGIRCVVVSHVEGWLEVQFGDESTAVIRPSRFVPVVDDQSTLAPRAAMR